MINDLITGIFQGVTTWIRVRPGLGLHSWLAEDQPRFFPGKGGVGRSKNSLKQIQCRGMYAFDHAGAYNPGVGMQTGTQTMQLVLQEGQTPGDFYQDYVKCHIRILQAIQQSDLPGGQIVTYQVGPRTLVGKVGIGYQLRSIISQGNGEGAEQIIENQYRCPGIEQIFLIEMMQEVFVCSIPGTKGIIFPLRITGQLEGALWYG